MSDKTKTTKDYVVVFDQLGVATGEFVPQGPNQPAFAVTETYERGDTVSLDDATAERHLAVGAIIPASDKRAKLVKPNKAPTGGVIRDVGVSMGAVELEQTAPATAGGAGVTRGKDGKLGTKAELAKLSVPALKDLAKEHGVSVERGDTKPKLAEKLSKIKVDTGDDTAADDGELRAGQEQDESPPPVDQPEDPPADDA